MSRVFISYRRSDAGGHALRVFERLRDRFGEQYVFFDQDAIEPGDHFPSHIEKAIRSAAVVLVVIGPDWLDSLNERAANKKTDFVRQEASISVERKRNPKDHIEVIPVLVGDATMPAPDQLHGDLSGPIGPLFEYQALALQGPQRDQDHQFEHLLTRIANICGIVPRASIANAGAPLVLSIQAPATGLPASGGLPQPITLPPVEVDKLERAFRLVSQMLLDWPQATEGRWIERPELSRLRELTSRESPSVTILLGGPGEGKSAILSRLGSLLSVDTTMLLAIKADRLPRDVASLRQLDEWIDCGVELSTALRRLAAQRRVVVLIDQLDALGDLMDQHSGRLSALLRLVESVRDTPNLHVIISCREFEFRHDVRLNTLRAEEVTLAPLQWEQVLPVLNARNIDTHRWSEEVRAVLSTPYNLAVYLQLLADDVPVPDFTSYQALLDRVLKERLEQIYGDSTVRAAERIAAEMAAHEQFSLARARFSDVSTELRNIESAGLLVSSDKGLTVSFRHQTLLDVLRARSFLRGGSSLTDYVVDQKQQSLLVRPTVWSTLNYLRASDTPSYRTEFLRLWRHPGLRLHLHYLLIAFLGHATDPIDEEAGWLFSKLDAPDTGPRVLRAVAGNATAWFSRLSDRLPRLMTQPPPDAWATASLLAGAINQHRDRVLALVQHHWMNNAPLLQHVLHVLCDLRSWNSQSMSVAFECVDRIVDQNTNDTLPIWRLMEAIARSSPRLSLDLFGHFLTVAARPITDYSSDDGVESGSSSPRAQAYEQLFHDTIWYQIGELFKAHPREIIEHVWPWFIGVFERLGRERIEFCNAYRGHDGLTFSQVARKSDLFQKAIEQAMCAFAENCPDAYVAFVEANEHSDLNVIHRLLSLGLERIAATRPQAALRYLLADPRRLAVGDIWDEHCVSVALIAAVAPRLGAQDVRRLEDTIIAWRYYSDDPCDPDPKRRLNLQKASREHRLPLLRAIPSDQLSPTAQRRLREEERAFPDESCRDRSPPRMRSVDSPMSAAQMADAHDGDIVRLFDTLADSTEWHHPTRGVTDLAGGSIQASREFGEFAKAAPDRALRIVDRFEPRKAERPAGAALAALGESDVPVGRLIEFTKALDARGFASESFRLDAARCLREVARRNRGLDDETCHMLEGWVIERPSAPGAGATDSDTTLTDADSIIWSHPGYGALPQGNYPILDALMLGHLLRNQPDLSGWLAVLERHLKRDEDPRVWNALARDMPCLVNADDGRGIRFLGALFVRYPTLLNTATGVRLIAQIVDRLPTGMTDTIINGWVSGDWAHGPQSAGEVAALNLCRSPDSEVARERVEQLLSGSNVDPGVVEALRIGMTYTLAEAWHHAELRELSTPLLILLIDHARGAVAKALHSMFRRGSSLPVDVHTREVLEAVLERPAVLVAQDVDFLVESLKGLLYEDGYPVLVHDLARALIEQAMQDSNETEAVRGLADLADLALTLHRIPATREHGLDLFERLLKADIPGLSESLRVLDRPAFR